MTVSQYAIGLVVTSLLFFVASGVAHVFVPIGMALLLGFVSWLAAAFLFVHSMRSKPAPQRS